MALDHFPALFRGRCDLFRVRHGPESVDSDPQDLRPAESDHCVRSVIRFCRIYGLQNLITERTLNNMACVTLATCWMVTYGYIMEAFMAWYSGDVFEQYMMKNRAFGPYGWIFWLLITVNIVIPQLLWSRRVRTHEVLPFCVALSANLC